MLVLSRKLGETIEFPGLDVVVRVIGLQRSKVQLGIEAPQHIAVHRGERAGASPGRGHSIEGHSIEERSIFDDLVRIEAELAALAELADPTDRPAVHRVAAESIERLEGVRRSIRIKMHQQDGVRPISDFMTRRTDLLEQSGPPSSDDPAIPWPATDRPRCVPPAAFRLCRPGSPALRELNQLGAASSYSSTARNAPARVLPFAVGERQRRWNHFSISAPQNTIVLTSRQSSSSESDSAVVRKMRCNTGT